MSGWVYSDPDCETCENSGFAVEELEPWRKASLALVACPDCYPEFLKITRQEREWDDKLMRWAP